MSSISNSNKDRSSLTDNSSNSNNNTHTNNLNTNFNRKEIDVRIVKTVKNLQKKDMYCKNSPRHNQSSSTNNSSNSIKEKEGQNNLENDDKYPSSNMNSTTNSRKNKLNALRSSTNNVRISIESHPNNPANAELASSILTAKNQTLKKTSKLGSLKSNANIKNLINTNNNLDSIMKLNTNKLSKNISNKGVVPLNLNKLNSFNSSNAPINKFNSIINNNNSTIEKNYHSNNTSNIVNTIKGITNSTNNTNNTTASITNSKRNINYDSKNKNSSNQEIKMLNNNEKNDYQKKLTSQISMDKYKVQCLQMLKEDDQLKALTEKLRINDLGAFIEDYFFNDLSFTYKLEFFLLQKNGNTKNKKTSFFRNELIKVLEYRSLDLLFEEKMNGVISNLDGLFKCVDRFTVV